MLFRGTFNSLSDKRIVVQELIVCGDNCRDWCQTEDCQLKGVEGLFVLPFRRYRIYHGLRNYIGVNNPWKNRINSYVFFYLEHTGSSPNEIQTAAFAPSYSGYDSCGYSAATLAVAIILPPGVLFFRMK